MRKPRIIVMDLMNNRGRDTAELIEFLRSSRCYEVMEPFASRKPPAKELQYHFPWARQLGLLHGADAVILGKIEPAHQQRLSIRATILECASGVPVLEAESDSTQGLARLLSRAGAIRKIRRTAVQAALGLIAAINQNKLVLTTPHNSAFEPGDSINLESIYEEIEDPCAPWSTLGYVSERLGKGLVLAIGNGWTQIRYLGCRPLAPGDQIKITKS